MGLGEANYYETLVGRETLLNGRDQYNWPLNNTAGLIKEKNSYFKY